MKLEFLIYISFIIYGLGFTALFFRSKVIVTYSCLFISSFMMRYFIATQDDFLHSWDERYHALVGKNLAKHPFEPTLKDNPILPCNNLDWQSGNVWVHKQPIFLFQIAASIKVFGNSEMAVRFPSIVMGALLSLLIFRIGSITSNSLSGYFASGMFIFSFFQLEQTAGVIGMDHNDIAFAFYVTLSIWGYLEYLESGNKRFVYMIALATAFGTLTKWLPALAIYGVWVIDAVLLDKQKRIHEIFLLFKSFCVSILIWGSWQIYILLRWPIETKFEYEFNRRHFSEELEGHGGNWDYHIKMFDSQYGAYAFILLFVGLLIFLLDKSKKRYKTLFLLIPISTYLVFSIAKTKSFAYVFYISPIVFTIIGYGLYQIITLITAQVLNKVLKYVFYCAILIFYCNYQLSAKNLYKCHVLGQSEYINNYRSVLQHNANIYKQLDIVASDCDIIFNCRNMQIVDAEFYSDKTVYSWFPDSTTIDSLIDADYKIGAFQGFSNQQLPDYIKNNNKIQIIDLIQATE